VERRLAGRDQLLKLVEDHAGALQELCWTGLQSGEPSTGHRGGLLSSEAQYTISRDKLNSIPTKTAGKMRPLGIPSADDKLVQEVVRMILERIYEPLFKDSSHGFRPGRSCHTALQSMQKGWTGTKWFVDIDIQGVFDSAC
jgi:Reverse transcriptase (RNA-dependent DNA polymerase)